MIPETEPDIERSDFTPSILAQAQAENWEAGFYDFGKAESAETTYFNPGLVKREDGLWLLVRRSEDNPNAIFGINSVWAIKLDESGRRPIGGMRLQWNGADSEQQFEDARAFFVPHLNQVGVSVCTFKWYGDNSWTGAIQVLGFFDNDWQCKITHYVPFDTNAPSMQNVTRERYQKNWLFWMRDRQLHLLYKSSPWIVAKFGNQWSEQRVYSSEGVKWSYGEIRGGTPPVLVDGRYYTFFHSSMPWQGNYRRYHMGAIAFSANPPFAPLAITKEPLLTGSQNDPWSMRKPACIFPCGAILNDGKWLISAGVNDLKSAWISMSHESLVERMSDITPSAPSKAVAQIPNAKLERQRAAMAKARAAMAEKRASKKNKGLIVKAH